MQVISAIRPILSSTLRFDRSQISLVVSLRNTIGLVTPLAVGALSGQLLAGVTASIGALQVAFADKPDPYRLRAARMLLVATAAALSVFVGSTTASIPWLSVTLVILWGFSGGLLAALGPTGLQIGLASIILFLVYGSIPLTPEHAIVQAGLILAGAALQTALSVAAWPVRRFTPELEALATVYRQLATYIRDPDPESPLPALTEMSAARTMLAGIGSGRSTGAEMLRVLVDETERIRLELLALDQRRRSLADRGYDVAKLRSLDELWSVAGEYLDILAETLSTGHASPRRLDLLHRLEVLADTLRQPSRRSSADPDPWRAERIQAHIDALVGQLRAAGEIADGGSVEGEERSARSEATLPPALRLRDPVGVLRANLTVRSASFRHAVRLAVSLGLATAIAHALGLGRAYWVPLTPAIVLRPDFTATFTRGIARIAGTLLGLALATGLVHLAFESAADRIVLAALLMFAIRSLILANYGLAVIAITALVVILTSFLGASPETTIAERGRDTLAGGALALAVYAIWPTWERTQIPLIVADLLHAYRQYFDAVMAGYLDPETVDRERLHATRLAARLARSNAESSLDRLRAEPVGSAEETDLADGLLASSRRFAHSVMTIEAGLYGSSTPSPPAGLATFVDDVDATLLAMTGTLRDPGRPLEGRPDLRSDQQAMVEAEAPDGRRSASAPIHALGPITSQTERMTNSLNTAAELLERSRQAERATAESGGR